MKPLTSALAIMLVLLTPAAGSALCLMDGFCEFVVTSERATFDLPVATPAILRLPDPVKSFAATNTSWELVGGADQVTVTPGKDPKRALLVVETVKGLRVAFHLSYERGKGVRYGIVSQGESQMSRWRDEGEVNNRVRTATARTAVEAALAEKFVARIVGARGKVLMSSASAQWIQRDLVVSVQARNLTPEPVTITAWQVDVIGGRSAEPIAFETTLGPWQEGPVALVLPDARDVGRLGLAMMSGGETVGAGQTKDWMKEHPEIMAVLEANKKINQDYENSDRIHLAAYGLIGAVMLDGMDGVEMGKEVKRLAL
jgi:hypothetical protein